MVSSHQKLFSAVHKNIQYSQLCDHTKQLNKF